MAMVRINEYNGNLNGKTVLLRADFDVPIVDGKITEPFRINKQKKTIDDLLSHGARVRIISHLGDGAQSFAPILPQICIALGRDIAFVDSLSSFVDSKDQLVLLENIRQWPEEKQNDVSFAEQLVQGCDLFVQNAFAACHRLHSSIAAMPLLLPSYAGAVVIEEVEKLSEILNAPPDGKVIILGGAKASTKIPMIHNILEIAEHILIGGVMANILLHIKGFDIKASRIDELPKNLLDSVDVNNKKILIPDDFVWSDDKILDIGPESTKRFVGVIKNAKLIVWNGPIGKYEDEGFSESTKKIANAVIESSGSSVIGGGDTISAVKSFGINLDKFGFVSTGGGAMLAFLSGEKLPGLTALDHSD